MAIFSIYSKPSICIMLVRETWSLPQTQTAAFAMKPQTFFIVKYQTGSLYWLLIALALSWRFIKVFSFIVTLSCTFWKDEYQNIPALFSNKQYAYYQGLYGNWWGEERGWTSLSPSSDVALYLTDTWKSTKCHIFALTINLTGEGWNKI